MYCSAHTSGDFEREESCFALSAVDSISFVLIAAISLLMSRSSSSCTRSLSSSISLDWALSKSLIYSIGSANFGFDELFVTLLMVGQRTRCRWRNIHWCVTCQLFSNRCQSGSLCGHWTNRVKIIAFWLSPCSTITSSSFESISLTIPFSLSWIIDAKSEYSGLFALNWITPYVCSMF